MRAFSRGLVVSLAGALGCGGGHGGNASPEPLGDFVEIGLDGSAPTSIAIDGGFIYYTVYGTPEMPTGYIGRVRIPDGLPERLVTERHYAGAIAVDDNHLYYTHNLNGSTVLERANKDGSQTVELDRGTNSAVMLDGDMVYWGGNGIRKIPKDGGAATTFVGDQTNVWGLAADDTTLYWTTRRMDQSGVYRQSKSGGTAERIATSMLQPTGLAFAGDRIVWVDYGTFADPYTYDCNGQIVASDRDGGSLDVLAAGLPQPQGVLVRDQHVYWVNAHHYCDEKPTLMHVSLSGGEAEVIDTSFSGTHDVVADDRWLCMDGTRLRCAPFL